jgi:hypothetical protein
MPKWICPVPNCPTWALAPATRPVHAKAPNPSFQAKDPHCPTHLIDLVWTPDSGATATDVEPTGPLAAIGSRDAMMGILVGHFGTVPIWCDLHQRKHISGGAWPGSTPQDKPLFLSSVYNQSNLTLGSQMVRAVSWDTCRDTGGVDIIFDCGTFVVGTDGETDILLQGGFTTQKSQPCISFHAYPVKNEGKQANTFKSAKLKNRILTLKL